MEMSIKPTTQQSKKNKLKILIFHANKCIFFKCVNSSDTYRAVKVIKIKHAADPCISREIQMIPYLYRIDSSLAKL